MFILAAECFVDRPSPEVTEVSVAVQRLSSQDVPVHQLTIDPLRSGWHTPLLPDHFRSGCAPIEALCRAKEILSAAAPSAVLIEGIDNLRSNYEQDRDLRRQLMQIYDHHSIPEAYTALAKRSLDLFGITREQFLSFRDELFVNFQSTARERGLPAEPPTERRKDLTDLFRHIDCANPVVDFAGRLLLANSAALTALGETAQSRLRIAGCGVSECSGDGLAFIDEIARYDHLLAAYRIAAKEVGPHFEGEFRRLFLANQALLEVYSCYPIVPLAFLLRCGLATDIAGAERLLNLHPVSVTGGMNLARAPWNNPALHALIVMIAAMKDHKVPFGCVHGNGGLGYKQGVAFIAAG